jgi:threonine dehydratase
MRPPLPTEVSVTEFDYTPQTIAQAQAALAPFLVKTPVHNWAGAEIDRLKPEGSDLWIKLELFQKSGTFKPRGALTVMLNTPTEALKRGVTAVSAGNHAIAVAYAANALGVSARVVMLGTANPARVARARAYGAEVIIAGSGAEAFELARGIAEAEGRSFIHPFEGPYTTLGTATLGAEIVAQMPKLDALIIPIGGGGLASGVALASKLLNPSCKVYGVQPVGADTMRRSFAAGGPVTAEPIKTIADSLGPPYTLPFSYAMCRKYVDEIVLLEDDAIMDGMALLFREMKLAVEPAGAASTAAALGPLRERLAGQRVGLIACGANIDVERFGAFVGQSQARTGLS